MRRSPGDRQRPARLTGRGPGPRGRRRRRPDAGDRRAASRDAQRGEVAAAGVGSIASAQGAVSRHGGSRMKALEAPATSSTSRPKKSQHQQHAPLVHPLAELAPPLSGPALEVYCKLLKKFGPEYFAPTIDVPVPEADGRIN